MYDVIVVGARCAGAASALLLARRGYQVLLIDRSTFPSDTMSTLYIHQPGVARLARWGLAQEVEASGCPRLDTISYQIGDLRLTSSAPSWDEAETAFAPRRRVLDQILVDAAVAAGAAFRPRTKLTALLWEDGRVAGAEFAKPTGGTVVERARLVIGADGKRSRVARLAGAASLTATAPVSCVYYTAWSGLRTGFGFYEQPGRWVVQIPTNDGITLVSTYFPQSEFPLIRASDPLAHHLAAVRETAPILASQLTAGRRVGRLMASGDQQNFFRQASGPGWALVGDAGHHLDSITARGITNAFIQAELFDQAIGTDLRDQRRLDAALQTFAVRRDAELEDAYRSTLELARLQLTESRLRMLRAISESPALTERYFAVVSGILPMDDFLTPELADLL
jgi:flavin-dependent dehydrogenase